MANKNVNVKLGANITDFQSKMKIASNTFQKTARQLKKTGKALTTSLTAPILGIGAAALKGAADLEKLEASFVSLTGGTKAAANMMKQLTDFTAKTPFQIDAVAKSARQLIASGTDVEQVNNQLQFLGDIAATSGSSIDDIAAIFAKVQSKGKVELESLNQLAERGIPIFTALSNATGLVPSKLGAGAVSVETFNKVLSSFNKAGGFAEGAMNRLSQTMSGKLSTAFDNLKLAAAELVKGLLPLVHKFLETITSLAQKFMSLDEGIKIAILTLAGLLAAIGPVLTIFGSLVSVVGFFMSPLGAVIAALAALAAAAIYVADNLEVLGQIGRMMAVSLGNAFLNIGQMLITPFELVIDGINKVLSLLGKEQFQNPFTSMKDGLEDLKGTVPEVSAEFGSFGDAVSNAAIKAKNALFGIGTSVGLEVSGDANSGGETSSEVSSSSSGVSNDGQESNLIVAQLIKIKDVATSVSVSLAQSFSQSFSQLVVSGQGMLRGLTDIFANLARQFAAMIIQAATLAAIMTLITGGSFAGAATAKGTNFASRFMGGLTGRASGGAVIAGQPFIVGEKGPELFMPGQSGTIIPNNNLSGGNITGQFVVQGTDLVAAINNQLESDYGSSVEKL